VKVAARVSSGDGSFSSMDASPEAPAVSPVPASLSMPSSRATRASNAAT
jgi:hypothetical protein